MAEARGLAETQHFGNPVDRHLVFAEQLLGLLESQLIQQLLITAPQVLEVPTQCPRRAIHLLGQPFEPRCSIQLRAEQLTNPPQPRLTSGELKVLLAAAFGHGLMGDDIRERQGLVEPALVEGKGVVPRFEVQRAVEVCGVGRLIVRRSMFEARGDQRQRVTEQVVAGDFQ